MPKFLIQGGQKLRGEVRISGSKNAALPCICACLLTREKCVLENVPDISDVHTLLGILRRLGVRAEFKKNQVVVEASNLKKIQFERKLTGCMRASILLLGPLLARLLEVNLPFPGGCVLGKRSVHAHLYAFKKLGAQVLESKENLHLKTRGLKGTRIIMAEASVTATENALMAAVLASGKTEIHWAAMEPHVQDLARFLNKMGAKIKGIGTPVLAVEGVKELYGASHTIIPDYLETATLVLAAVLTQGKVVLKNAAVEHLDSFWQKLEEVGAKFKLGENTVTVYPAGKFKPVGELKTAVYPGFATDLQAPFAVLLTQASGESRVFETLFEGRLNYLFELEKLGARAKVLNPHQAVIFGSAKLKAAPIASCDIRAGAALVLAALIAEGTTEISEINYLDRGYEKLDQKLRKLGAKIKRV